MFEFLKAKPKGTGALLDTRPQAEKEKDFLFSETVTEIDPVVWVNKPESQWRKFPISDQNGSGSCVAQTMKKMLGIMYWLKTGTFIPFSASHIYKRRVNKPNAGMGGTDVFEIVRKGGATLEQFAPSEKMTDAQMDAVALDYVAEQVALPFKLGNYVVVDFPTIEKIASIIQKTGKPVMTWFFFEYDEWTTVPAVKYPTLNAGSATCRHSVTAVDFTMYEGKKALIIEDSWGTSYGKAGQRVITEDFFAKRNYFCAYAINFAYDTEPTPTPSGAYKFGKPMYFYAKPTDAGSLAQKADVVALQNILKKEGLFATNIASTGYYGAITAKAVLAYKAKYALGTNGKEVGADMVAHLNNNKFNV